MAGHNQNFDCDLEPKGEGYSDSPNLSQVRDGKAGQKQLVAAGEQLLNKMSV